MAPTAACPRPSGPWIVGWTLLLGLALPPPSVAEHAPTALVPVERLATGFHDLRGLAWGPDGALYASDREAGVIYRVDPAGPGAARVTVRQAGLRHPAGLAVDPDGFLVVAEEGAGRLVRLNGTPTPLWTGLHQPTWIAIAPDGTLYVTAHAAPPPHEARDGDRLLRHRPGTATADVLLAGLHQPGGLWVEPAGTLLLSVEKRAGESERESPALLRVDPTRSPTDPAFVTVLWGPGGKHPVGPVPDALGGLVLGAEAPPPVPGEPPPAKDGLLTLRPGEAPHLLGTGFKDVRGLAFDPQGHLYVALQETIYCLRAPAAPSVEAPPPFTNQATVTLRGTALPGSAVTGLGGPAATTTLADGQTGAFTLAMPLTPNAENALRIYTTSAQGWGLPSAPTEVTLVQDARPPTVAVTTPTPGALVRGTLEVTGKATETMVEGEAWSGVVTLILQQAGTALVTALNPTPGSPATHAATALVNTTALVDGLLDFAAVATDRAGNSARDTSTVTVDNTPPTVAVTTSPSGATVSGTVAITVVADDATSGLASLTLLVDGVLRQSSETSPLTYSLNTRALTDGPHTLTATAQDRAGNLATVPRTITVQNLRVTITEPANSAILTQDRVRVSGTVEGQGEIGVVVNGVVAAVDGPRWVAEIPLLPGSNVIIATATDTLGVSITDRVTAQVTQIQEAKVTLTASPTSGLGPLTVWFQADAGWGRPLIKYELDYDGDGTTDLTSVSFDNIQFTYATPGIITPTIKVTDDQGQTFTAMTTIQILDKALTIALLQAKWDTLKTALQARDLSRAMTEFAIGVRPRFLPVFQTLGADLPMIASTFGPVAITRVTEGLAEGVTQRVHAGKSYLYFIYWAPDSDGIWRIIEM